MYTCVTLGDISWKCVTPIGFQPQRYNSSRDGKHTTFFDVKYTFITVTLYLLNACDWQSLSFTADNCTAQKCYAFSSWNG